MGECCRDRFWSLPRLCQAASKWLSRVPAWWLLRRSSVAHTTARYSLAGRDYSTLRWRAQAPNFAIHLGGASVDHSTRTPGAAHGSWWWVTIDGRAPDWPKRRAPRRWSEWRWFRRARAHPVAARSAAPNRSTPPRGWPRC